MRNEGGRLLPPCFRIREAIKVRNCLDDGIFGLTIGVGDGKIGVLAYRYEQGSMIHSKEFKGVKT